MRINSLASAVVIALCSFAASATSTTPVQVSGPTFADVELGSFTLTGTSNVTGAFGFAPYVLIAPAYQIPLPAVSFDSVSVYNDSLSRSTSGTLSGESFTFSALLAGSYRLRSSGSLAGSNFIGAEFTVTAVPEPASFALLLAGLGLLGFMRRRQPQGQHVGASNWRSAFRGQPAA